MDAQNKVKLLAESARHDICLTCSPPAGRVADDIGHWLYPAALPRGGHVTLLKVLQTNVCDNNCGYCAQRRGRDTRRTSFTPDELAATFMEMQHKKLVTGLFLSSGIHDSPARSMDRTLATVELLRRRYRFSGYIHLKILPGVSMAHVEQAVRLATRVSVNLEAPAGRFLRQIAPDKRFEELVKPMVWARDLINGSGGMWSTGGQTTQFVVGASGESDRELLTTVSHLYRDVNLRRAYFSAFVPIDHTPLESQAATPLWREHRLYQSDSLMRQYGFAFDDLVFDEEGNLPAEGDPKQMWADRHPERFPVEINRADRHELMRVPGIGPTSADRIVTLRRQSPLRSLHDLASVGAVSQRAAPYVLLNGRRPPYQIPLPEWAAA
jgi:predicted DNA-binding helix-hairpin-helix protein